MPDVNFLKKSVVKVQQRSAFDKSFRNLLTTKCGTLTPILCDEVIPNTTINLKLAINCTLPPLASETFMNVNLKTEAFFVPSRLLMLGYERFIQGDTDIKIGTSDQSSSFNKLRVPVVRLDSSSATTTSYLGAGKLSDYLGLRAKDVTGTVDICALPFLAYHFIWDTWYRNSIVQRSAFDDGDFMNTNLAWTPRAMKYRYPTDHGTYGYRCSLGWQFADGVHVGDLRQRNFGSDYFTVATPKAQKGNPSFLKMSLPQEIDLLYNTISAEAPIATATGIYAPRDSDSSTGAKDGTISVGSIRDQNSEDYYTGFTIASLRAANSLQQWLERNNIAGNRLVDFVKAQYNANLKDSIAQRPVYLGSASFPVYSKGVYQTARDNNTGNNPFNSVGSRYGHAYAEGTDFIINHYTAEEPGYIMVLASLVPEVTYAGGVNKYLMRYTEADSYGELANPILQNIGAEPIRQYEFNDYLNGDDSFGIFGYTDRYASWMTRLNEIHGLLKDGQTLESFALQRSGGTDGISTEFLTIPTNYMDQVTAVDNSISNYGCWIDSYLDYKVVMPLAKYSVPSLQDPAYEHGDTVVLDRAGRHID